MTSTSPSTDVGHVVAVVSQKGGVGKTTTAVNLAAALARSGTRTLLVDVDPQGSVRYGIGLPPDRHGPGLADYVAGRRPLAEVILPTVLPTLHVLLVGSVAEAAEHAEYERRVHETPLLEQLLATAREKGYVVVVDTPPGLGALVQRVLAASDRVVVPLQCEPLALQTTPQILRGLQHAAERNDRLTVDGLLLTMYDEADASCRRVAEYVREHVPRELLLDVAIPRSAGAVEAFGAGQPIVLRDPDDPAATAYTALASELAARMD